MSNRRQQTAVQVPSRPYASPGLPLGAQPAGLAMEADTKVSLSPRLLTREGGRLKAVEFLQEILTLTVMESNPKLLVRLRKHLENHYAAAEACTVDDARVAFQDRVQALQLAISMLERDFERGQLGPAKLPPLA